MKRENRSKKGVCFFFIFSLMAVSIPAAFAADEPYPNRPINVIINMAPGSLMDNHARILGERLAELLGQPFLRIHKPGGEGPWLRPLSRSPSRMAIPYSLGPPPQTS